MINLLDNRPNQPFYNQFRAKSWFEVNDDPWGMYNINSQIKFKATMLISSLRDYSDGSSLYLIFS